MRFQHISIDPAKMNCLDTVYQNLYPLNSYYPGFFHWYNKTVYDGLLQGTRFIDTVFYGDELAGVLITKNDGLEQKICTLRVMDKYRKSGIGRLLFQRSFALLGCEKPIITIPEYRIFEFDPLLKYFGFQLEMQYRDYYKSGVTEYAYNGIIDRSQSRLALPK